MSYPVCSNRFKSISRDHYPQALTLARTGMRLGEALALQWDDIDFEERFITIQGPFQGEKSGCRKMETQTH
jgi:integrase